MNWAQGENASRLASFGNRLICCWCCEALRKKAARLCDALLFSRKLIKVIILSFNNIIVDNVVSSVIN
jgi:hypothetical protein